jgi:hypothetical protein
MSETPEIEAVDPTVEVPAQSETEQAPTPEPTQAVPTPVKNPKAVPPLSETEIGVKFQELISAGNATAAMYWNILEDAWSNLTNAVEAHSSVAAVAEIGDQLISASSPDEFVELLATLSPDTDPATVEVPNEIFEMRTTIATKTDERDAALEVHEAELAVKLAEVQAEFDEQWSEVESEHKWDRIPEAESRLENATTDWVEKFVAEKLDATSVPELQTAVNVAHAAALKVVELVALPPLGIKSDTSVLPTARQLMGLSGRGKSASTLANSIHGESGTKRSAPRVDNITVDGKPLIITDKAGKTLRQATVGDLADHLKVERDSLVDQAFAEMARLGVDENSMTQPPAFVLHSDGTFHLNLRLNPADPTKVTLVQWVPRNLVPKV